MTENLKMKWQPIGQIDPRLLLEVRLQLHWAAQVPASVGLTFVEPEPDYSHLSFSARMDSGVFRLVSRRATTGRGFRAGIRLADLTLEFIDEEDRFVDRLHLHRRTLDEAYAWLEQAISVYTGERTSLIRPDHELPEHAVASGTPFVYGESTHFEAMERWYSNAAWLLSVVRDEYDPSLPLRCWPHHMDLAFLLVLDPDVGLDEARSIGVGFSPGDASYEEPYFYVNHWPRTTTGDLPRLRVGSWHTEGWVGAVLRGSELARYDTAPMQAESARAFVETAVEASIRLLPED